MDARNSNDALSGGGIVEMKTKPAIVKELRRLRRLASKAETNGHPRRASRLRRRIYDLTVKSAQP
jgi:hypothetical protein